MGSRLKLSHAVGSAWRPASRSSDRAGSILGAGVSSARSSGKVTVAARPGHPSFGDQLAERTLFDSDQLLPGLRG